MAELKKYKVIALSVGARGNKIFNAGDEVCESNFIEGRAEELVKGGFLKPLDADSSAGNDSKEITDASSAKEIKAVLKEMEITFPSNASKADLYALYLKSVEDAKALAELENEENEKLKLAGENTTTDLTGNGTAPDAE